MPLHCAPTRVAYPTLAPDLDRLDGVFFVDSLPQLPFHSQQLVVFFFQALPHAGDVIRPRGVPLMLKRRLREGDG